MRNTTNTTQTKTSNESTSTSSTSTTTNTTCPTDAPTSALTKATNFEANRQETDHIETCTKINVLDQLILDKDRSKVVIPSKRSIVAAPKRTIQAKVLKLNPKQTTTMSTSTSTAIKTIQVSKTNTILQENRRKCWSCRVKLPLVAVTCRCGYTFCNKHRYPEEHACQFNFRLLAKTQLELENPRIMAVKIARID